MIINNISEDVNRIISIEGESHQTIANKIGVAQPSISRSLKNAKFPDGFIKIMDCLGYDLKITYIKKQKTAADILKGGKL